MAALTLEQRDYKERTLNQLQTNLPLLEAKLAQESRREVIVKLENQLAEMQAHAGRLQAELVEGVAGEAVADEYCVRIARALSNEKFHLARRYIEKLETIEPFYPGLERLKSEVEAGRASRRTRSIAQGNAVPYGAGFFATTGSVTVPEGDRSTPVAERSMPADDAERGGLGRFFQFHIVLSCLVISLIVCVMSGIGGMNLLQWLIEGQ